MSAGAEDDSSDPPPAGSRVVATDPRTGVRVLGRVEDGDPSDDPIRVDPLGPGYPPGPFDTDREAIEKLADPGSPVDAYESRKRKEWDITCMVMSGALENLRDQTVDVISNRIAEGHV